MKKHNILKVILLSILVVVVCTWIFPSATYQYEFTQGDRSQVGVFDLFSYLSVVFQYFSNIIMVALATGMFYGVAYKIPAYRNLLDRIVKKYAGKELIFLSVIMALIAIIVSVTGLSFTIIFVFPFVISLVLLMGYNKLVAASVTVGSTVVGILGTTFGTATTYYINSILGTDFNSELISKAILLVVGLGILIYNVTAYAKKTKNEVDKVSELVPTNLSATIKEEKVVVKEAKKVSTKKEDTKKETKKDSKKTSKAKTPAKKTTKKTTKTKAYDLKSRVETKVVVKKKEKKSIWQFVAVFDLVVILLAVATFDWTGVLKVNWFTTALDAVNDFEIAGFPIFAKILGNVTAFGSWSYEIPTLIVLATCYLGFIYRLKMDEFLDGITSGIKKAIRPTIYMFIIYLVLVVVTYNPFQLNFTKFFLDLSKGLNVVTMTVTAMIASLLNVECIYATQSTLPYVTSVITDTSVYPLIGVIFQAVYGLVMLVAPTSVILLGTLSYLGISYGQWLKHIWKVFLELLVVLIIVFIIIFLI